jgi:hypothetical protein
MMADGFPHAPPQSVAHYGLSHRSRRGEAKTGGQIRFRQSQAERGKITAGHADTGLINQFKFGRAQNPMRFRK